MRCYYAFNINYYCYDSQTNGHASRSQYYSCIGHIYIYYTNAFFIWYENMLVITKGAVVIAGGRIKILIDWRFSRCFKKSDRFRSMANIFSCAYAYALFYFNVNKIANVRTDLVYEENFRGLISSLRYPRNTLRKHVNCSIVDILYNL